MGIKPLDKCFADGRINIDSLLQNHRGLVFKKLPINFLRNPITKKHLLMFFMGTVNLIYFT